MIRVISIVGMLMLILMFHEFFLAVSIAAALVIGVGLLVMGFLSLLASTIHGRWTWWWNI